MCWQNDIEPSPKNGSIFCWIAVNRMILFSFQTLLNISSWYLKIQLVLNVNQGLKENELIKGLRSYVYAWLVHCNTAMEVHH